MAAKLPDVAGLSVLMPLPTQWGENNYKASHFARDTGWLDVIQKRFGS